MPKKKLKTTAIRALLNGTTVKRSTTRGAGGKTKLELGAIKALLGDRRVKTPALKALLSGSTSKAQDARRKRGS